MPNHTFNGEWGTPNVVGGGGSVGISLASMTVDSEEHATRFVKDLFKHGYVSAVQMFDGGFERSYLKFGRPTTEKTRVRLEMVVADGQLTGLIDYVNNNNPTMYDYPVPDVTVIPVTQGNQAFIDWAKAPTKIDYDKVYKQ
jgi:uncharacterized protein involved in tolerance to divalent cations